MAWSVDLSGRRALVTGGASGIGHAIALGLLEAGARVTATARTKASLEACAAETPHGPLDLRRLDVTNPISIDGLMEELDGLDILVNNAGEVRGGLEFQPDQFADVINVNLMGVQRMSHACLPKLALAKGCILNIASMWSYFGAPHAPAYTASKTGVVGLTRSLAHAWAEHGIRVNAIAPGWIETKLSRPAREDPERNRAIGARIPLGRWGVPSDVAGAAVFLCSPAAAYVTGATLAVDGGYTAA